MIHIEIVIILGHQGFPRLTSVLIYICLQPLSAAPQTRFCPLIHAFDKLSHSLRVVMCVGSLGFCTDHP